MCNITVCRLIVWRLIISFGERTNIKGRPIHLMRSTIILDDCYVESERCPVTCLSELKDSTGLCRTSLSLQYLYNLFLQTRLYKLPQISMCMSFLRISGVRWHIICGTTSLVIWYGMAKCLTRRFCHLLMKLLQFRRIRSKLLRRSTPKICLTHWRLSGHAFTLQMRHWPIPMI